ncbi:MAG: glycosyltransferase family A protein [Pseudomonadota bacterium]
MARVTVGIPVYNGAPLIRESLECLRTQTFDDFVVLIGDNASEDETAEICADFAARDPRFIHIRRPENIGSLPNFTDLRRRAESELFMWRAYDDLSAPNFIESLVGCFRDNDEVCLAVGDVVSHHLRKGETRRFRYRAPPSGPRIASILHQLFSSHECWIYGLWRREAIGEIQDRVSSIYPHAWGWDHLCLLPLILDRKIAGTNETEFVQRVVHGTKAPTETLARPSANAAPKPPYVDAARQGLPALGQRIWRPTKGVDLQAELWKTRALTGTRGQFDKSVRAEVGRRTWTLPERAALAVALPRYVDLRGYSRLKLWRRRVREQLSEWTAKPDAGGAV